MLYEYKCKACGLEVEICKSLSDFDRVEHCENCQSKLSRQISISSIDKSSLENPYFSHALGRMVSCNKEERLAAKKLGAIEVGNEKEYLDKLKPVPKEY